MHISDGIIQAEICIAADAVAITAIYALGKKATAEEIPRMGLMAAALFTASLIHFPIAGTSIHLGLYGLAGILLGMKSLPVVFSALLFQSLIFQHGGLLSVGLNTINMSAGAIIAWVIWRSLKIPVLIRAFLAGFTGILIPALLMASEFNLSGYGKGIFVIIYIYLIAATIEGLLTASIIKFIEKTEPEMLPRRGSRKDKIVSYSMKQEK